MTIIETVKGRLESVVNAGSGALTDMKVERRRKALVTEMGESAYDLVTKGDVDHAHLVRLTAEIDALDSVTSDDSSDDDATA